MYLFLFSSARFAICNPLLVNYIYLCLIYFSHQWVARGFIQLIWRSVFRRRRILNKTCEGTCSPTLTAWTFIIGKYCFVAFNVMYECVYITVWVKLKPSVGVYIYSNVWVGIHFLEDFTISYNSTEFIEFYSCTR